MDIINYLVIIILFLGIGLYLWNNYKFIDTLITRNDKLSKDFTEIASDFKKAQQQQINQINELSGRIIDLHNTLDSKLESQSNEFKKDLNKVNSKVDTILGLVLECDGKDCPTKKKVSNYLRNREILDKE